MSLFSIVEIFFIGFQLLWLLLAVQFLFCYHSQIYSLAGYLFCYISYLGRGNNLFDFCKIFIPRVKEGYNSYLKVVMQRIESNDKCYTLPNYLIFYDCGLETLYGLFHLHKDSRSLNFIFKGLHNFKIVQEFFEN